MDKIGRKITSFLPARSDDKVRSMATRCLEELKACPSDDSRMETAEKYLDWIARRGKDGVSGRLPLPLSPYLREPPNQCGWPDIWLLSRGLQHPMRKAIQTSC